MWIIFLLIWFLISFALAYPLSNSLYKHYQQNLQISFKLKYQQDDDDLTEMIIKLKNHGVETLTIKEVGIFYKGDNQHIPLEKLIDDSNNYPIILKQKETALFKSFLVEFPLDIEDIQRAYLKVYVKLDNDKYLYEVI